MKIATVEPLQTKNKFQRWLWWTVIPVAVIGRAIAFVRERRMSEVKN